jgi:hypothetical protein
VSYSRNPNHEEGIAELAHYCRTNNISCKSNRQIVILVVSEIYFIFPPTTDSLKRCDATQWFQRGIDQQLGRAVGQRRAQPRALVDRQRATGCPLSSLSGRTIFDIRHRIKMQFYW